MLPQAVFDQVVKTSGIRSEVSRHERRGAMRVPMRGMTEVRAIVQGCALPAFNVRIRDVSQTGVAILLMGKQILPREFLVRLDMGERRSVTLFCDTRRVSSFDGVTVVSAQFLKMMLPGQQIIDNLPIATLQWHTFKPVVPVPNAA